MVVRIRDWGGESPIPDVLVPDLEAKVNEEQSPRGWGLFLIKHLVDGMHTKTDGTQHTIELLIHRKETADASANA